MGIVCKLIAQETAHRPGGTHRCNAANSSSSRLCFPRLSSRLASSRALAKTHPQTTSATLPSASTNSLKTSTRLQTPATLIDFIGQLFANELPPAWATASLRARLAQREYESATDPAKRISEQHLTETWNSYVTTIGAEHESHISPAELHNLRDSLYAVAGLTWARGSRNFWSVPSIFATEPDGTLAPGCRLVESLRLLWDLANIPENLRVARDRASKGILTSDLLKQAQQKPPSSSVGSRAFLSVTVHNNPVEDAETQYIRENGMPAFTNLIQTMLNTL